MRKIEAQLSKAWDEQRPCKIGNSAIVKLPNGGLALTLHGHTIAERTPSGRVRVTFAGWPTRTTLSRLYNVVGLPHTFRHRSRRKTGEEWIECADGVEIDPSAVFELRK